MTASTEQQGTHEVNENQQLSGASAGSCTINHIPRDNPASRLTVAAHEHEKIQASTSTQYISQKEMGVLAPAYTNMILRIFGKMSNG